MVYGSFYNFNINSFFNSVDTSVVVWATLLAVCVLVLYFALSRMFRNNKAISVALAVIGSILIIYFLSRSGALENLILNIQFIDIKSFLPWIFLVISALIIWRLGIGVYLMLISGGAILLLFLGTLEKNGIALTTAIILFLVGIKLFQIRRRKRKWKKMGWKERRYEKGKWKAKKAKQAQNWNKAGYKVGYYGSKGVYAAGKGVYNAGKGIRKRIGNIKKFDYEAGMRRGGTTKRRSRFVGRNLTNRYARRFGNAAARKKFKK